MTPELETLVRYGLPLAAAAVSAWRSQAAKSTAAAASQKTDGVAAELVRVAAAQALCQVESATLRGRVDTLSAENGELRARDEGRVRELDDVKAQNRGQADQLRSQADQIRGLQHRAENAEGRAAALNGEMDTLRSHLK